jgi:hypothetical protein
MERKILDDEFVYEFDCSELKKVCLYQWNYSRPSAIHGKWYLSVQRPLSEVEKNEHISFDLDPEESLLYLHPDGYLREICGSVGISGTDRKTSNGWFDTKEDLLNLMKKIGIKEYLEHTPGFYEKRELN